MRFAAIIFIFLFYVGNAQDRKVSVFKPKPSIGLNACQVHGDAYSGYKKPGLFAGLAVNAWINDDVSIELGFYFSQKGAWKNPSKYNSDYYHLNLNYIDIPVSIRYMLNKRYFVTAGPSVAYLISYRENFNYIDITGDNDFKKYEIGINIGLGRTIVRNFSCEVRCSNSIDAIREYGAVSHIFYNNGIARYFNKGFYNNILTLMLTYTIDNKRKIETE